MECTRKKTGGQEVAVAVYFTTRVHSFERLPSNSYDRSTTSRALRRKRVGPRERPAVRVPHVCELCLYTGVVERYCQESTCNGGWVMLKKFTVYVPLHVVGFSFFSRQHFQIMLAVV